MSRAYRRQFPYCWPTSTKHPLLSASVPEWDICYHEGSYTPPACRVCTDPCCPIFCGFGQMQCMQEPLKCNIKSDCPKTPPSLMVHSSLLPTPEQHSSLHSLDSPSLECHRINNIPYSLCSLTHLCLHGWIASFSSGLGTVFHSPAEGHHAAPECWQLWAELLQTHSYRMAMVQI